MEEYSSESDEETPVCESTSVPEQRGHAFPAATVAVLRAYHQKGMVGTGRDHSSMIGEAAHETGLEEVKVDNGLTKHTWMGSKTQASVRIKEPRPHQYYQTRDFPNIISKLGTGHSLLA